MNNFIEDFYEFMDDHDGSIEDLHARGKVNELLEQTKIEKE